MELESALRLIWRTERWLLPVEGAGHELIGKAKSVMRCRTVVEAFRAFTGSHP